MSVDDGLCARVRRTCSRVMETSRLVTIDDTVLDKVAATLPDSRPLPRRGSTGPVDEAAATLVFALDAINFGSGYHDIVRKRPGLSGARTMAAAFRDHVGSTGPLTPERLGSIDAADCSRIFGQELDGAAREELMTLFAQALHDLGVFLGDAGGAIALLAAADRSAETLAERLADMPFYRDEHRLDSRPVAFYKRAQITPADLCRELRLDLFDDLERLTAFADNLVPHVLRVDEVLTYDPALAATIDRGELLEPGGRAEIEIRAAGVECVERLAARTGLPPMTIDLLLWERGGLPAYKAVRRHRARSVFY